VATGVLLVIAQNRGAVIVTTDIPWGTAGIYFGHCSWALAVLVAGALFSLREGIEELIHPSLTSRFAVALCRACDFRCL